MTRLFIHNVFFRICSGPVFGAMAHLLILLINNTVESIDEMYNHEELYVCIALSYISFESMRLMLKVLDKYQTEGTFQKKMAIRIVATIFVSQALIMLAISSYFRFVIGFTIGNRELNLFLIVFGFAGLMYNILYFSHFYLQQENKVYLEEENKMREKVEADFSSFRNEINPDLLYESLENLILTLHTNADQAEEQIDSLAGIYRYSLVNRQRELISLAEELTAAENLLHLLNYKYAGCIGLSNEVSTAEGIFLIPGSLLVTIDSIVRNTLISPQSRLLIKVYTDDDDDYLIVEHKLNNKLVLHTQSLNSFAQLQRSYLFFSEKPFIQIKAGNENFIKFPIVRIAQNQEQTL